MKQDPPPNKPPEKRGVNKATMDSPQEEFVDDQSSSSKRSSQTPEPSEVTPGRDAEEGKSQRQ